MPKIVLRKDSEIIQIFRLEAKSLRVGSDQQADVKIDDWTVGKEEAIIWPKGQTFCIKPAGAFPQLAVNGAEVSGERALSDGDEIKIGPYILVFSRLPEETEVLAVEVPPIPSMLQLQQPEAMASKPPPPPTAEPEFEVPTGKISQVHQPSPAKPKEPAVSRPAARDAPAERARLAALPERTKIGDVFETPARADEYYLLAVWGPLAGRRFQLKPGETKMGRDKEANEIVVRKDEQGELDTSISRRHASLFWSSAFSPSGVDFCVIDVGSKLGVMVNGKKIRPEKGFTLKPGDEIGILSEKVPTIFRLASNDRLDFAPPRMGRVPKKNPFFAQKFFWIIAGIIILLLVLVWIFWT